MKQVSGTDDMNYSAQGFRLFNDAICGYGSCTSSAAHYHCMACGFAAIDVQELTNHRNTCPAPSFSQSNNFPRNLEAPGYPSTSPQGQECSYYPMYGLSQTTLPPTMSPGSGSFYRTQPAVFSPFYSANSLGYESYGQGPDSWTTTPRTSSSRENDRLTSCKENRSTKVPLPASSSCLYSQNYSSELYTDTSALDSCLLSRGGHQSSSRGNLQSNTNSSVNNQKQLPGFEPSLGFVIDPEDGMYSPAPFSFHMGSDSFVSEHKASPFTGVEVLPGDSCLGLPFPPAPSQQPPSCLLEHSGEEQDSDLGSDEHEIIVEETGEDQPSESEHHCVVCSGRCGWAAVELRVDHPLTLSTHMPVWAKLAEVLGVRLQSRLQPGQMLCSTCLQLLHTVDQLQAQLTEATQRFLGRLQDHELTTNPPCAPQEEPTLGITTVAKEDDIIIEKSSCMQTLTENKSECRTEIIEPIERIEPMENECIVEPIEPPVPELLVDQNSQSSFLCEPCGRSFETRHSLACHMKRHIRAESKPPQRLVCELCGKQFSSRPNLAAHKPICSGQYPLRCRTCGKGFVLRTKLTIHEATHQGHFPFVCDICNKGFIKQSDLRVHKRTHSGEKPFVCEICGKRFANSGNYNHHSKLHTNKEKPFSCTICKKGFMRRSYLKVHMNRHSGNKPFRCDLCNKAFPDRSNLHHHRRLHEGFKPYTCPVCGKALSSGLQAHLRTHSGVRPFACSVCGQTFTANSSLNKHLKIRHADNQLT